MPSKGELVVEKTLGDAGLDDHITEYGRYPGSRQWYVRTTWRSTLRTEKRRATAAEESYLDATMPTVTP